MTIMGVQKSWITAQTVHGRSRSTYLNFILINRHHKHKLTMSMKIYELNAWILVYSCTGFQKIHVHVAHIHIVYIAYYYFWGSVYIQYNSINTLSNNLIIAFPSSYCQQIIISFGLPLYWGLDLSVALRRVCSELWRMSSRRLTN